MKIEAEENISIYKMESILGRKSVMKRFRCSLSILLCIFILGSSYYFFNYYPMGKDAKNIYVHLPEEKRKGDVVLSVENPKATILFYPGAKVDERAYLPLLHQIQQEGIEVKIYKMPLHFAIFGMKKAENDLMDISAKHRVFMMGHSLGGAMAAKLAENYPREISGLILLGAYPYGDYPLNQTLAIYGSKEEKIRKKNLAWIDKGLNVVEIQGGNHSGFGDYGLQKNDPPGDISQKQQWQQTKEVICQFITSKVSAENI